MGDIHALWKLDQQVFQMLVDIQIISMQVEQKYIFSGSGKLYIDDVFTSMYNDNEP